MDDLHKIQKYAADLTLLYAEDDEAIAQRVINILSSLFAEVVHVSNGKEGLAACKLKEFDLIISDISMPHMNGVEMAKIIREQSPKQKIIFSTAHSESKYMLEAIRLNVDGYLIKPIDHNEFLALLAKVTQEIASEKLLQFYQDHLEDEVSTKTKELLDANQELLKLNMEVNNTLESTILALGGVAEARSHETGLHVQRVALYCEFLAKELGLSDEQAAILRLVSPMHDIGKLAIEDSILKKPGKLTDEEYKKMKEHAKLGYEMLASSNLKLFQEAAVVAHEHHEKWDGTGYPRGLKGEETHIFGRITAFCDVFDALISERVYKKAWSMDKIIAFAKEQRGVHFDPQVVDCFLNNLEFFEQTNARLQD